MISRCCKLLKGLCIQSQHLETEEQQYLIETETEVKTEGQFKKVFDIVGNLPDDFAKRCLLPLTEVKTEGQFKKVFDIVGNLPDDVAKRCLLPFLDKRSLLNCSVQSRRISKNIDFENLLFAMVRKSRLQNKSRISGAFFCYYRYRLKVYINFTYIKERLLENDYSKLFRLSREHRFDFVKRYEKTKRVFKKVIRIFFENVEPELQIVLFRELYHSRHLIY